MAFVLAFRGSALFGCRSEIFHLLEEVGHREAGDRGVFGAAFTVRIVAEGEARTSGRRPCATMSGIFGWSPGNQSAGPKPSRICVRVNSRSLPARRFGVVSGGACAPRPPPPAGAAGAPGCGNPYAHAGGPSAANEASEALTVNTDASAKIRIPDRLVIGPYNTLMKTAFALSAALLAQTLLAAETIPAAQAKEHVGQTGQFAATWPTPVISTPAGSRHS